MVPYRTGFAVRPDAERDGAAERARFCRSLARANSGGRISVRRRVALAATPSDGDLEGVHSAVEAASILIRYF